MMAEESTRDAVDFSSVVRRTAEEAYLGLKQLVDMSVAESEGRSAEEEGDEAADAVAGRHQRSDSEKKIDLLKFIARTRQRMLRLHVLAKWCQQVPLVNYCQQLESTLSSHDKCFTQTADSLFYMREGLHLARAPIFDVPSAVETLRTGNYSRMPRCIEDIGMQSALSEDEQKPALKNLHKLVQSKILEVVIPKEVTSVRVSDGCVFLQVDGEFKVILTLGYRSHFSLWRIIYIELLVGGKRGVIKMEESRRYALGDDLERRMAVSENPFMVLYSILHEFCLSLAMDTVIGQVHILRMGRWKDAVKFELTDNRNVQSSTATTQDGVVDSLGSKIPGLKITYWLDREKVSGSSESDPSPSIRIEVGQDLQIKCTHSSFILDPLTDKECNLTIYPGRIDVEKLLLMAIACNRHTRLILIQRELVMSNQIYQSSSDVVLKHRKSQLEKDSHKKEDVWSLEDYSRTEVLQVRAHGNSFIALGINIRSGFFSLQTPKNILPPSSLTKLEEAMNKGSVTATEVFSTLRMKSILHLFASSGRFLGLKVYDQHSNNLKIPKSILGGVNSLVLEFPHYGNSYCLLIQLNNLFRPVFYLLDKKHDEGGKQIIRQNKIDSQHIQVFVEGSEMNLLHEEKLWLQQNNVTHDRLVDNGDHFEGAVQDAPVLDKIAVADSLSPHGDHYSKKRPFSDLLSQLPSLQGNSHLSEQSKKMKISGPAQDSSHFAPAYLSNAASRMTILMKGSSGTDGKSSTTTNSYISTLFHVMRYCSMCIKCAQLTTQMDSLNIPYVEETGFPRTSTNLWLQLPFSDGDSWRPICLRLAASGSMSWDVKITDPYFKELHGLKNPNSVTPWGAGVRIADTPEMDSHITFDHDGVILTYKTVEPDSIKRLISDLHRLSNAQVFSCGMRRLIGSRSDDKPEEKLVTSESKLTSATNGCDADAVDRLSEQLRKTFRIEAVGLMSLWFSYGSVPMVHFVVEWVTGKEGCTMHVSPDQLWPHTMFLEDFVNGGEVASFLYCIRLTAGPLLALGGAIRPVRMPIAVSSNYTSGPKTTTAAAPSQGPLASGNLANIAQPQSVIPASVLMPQVGNSNLHAAAMLSNAGRGGPGLVPSSLLPFDVAIVLRGPYWIRVMYRKKFAFDMRCFAGDQVWLQPAAPPKGGPSLGGSLPCPQFRPFIMEHVAQGLNSLEPSFLNSLNPANVLMNTAASTGSSGLNQFQPNPNRLGATLPSGAPKQASGVGNISRGSNTHLSSSGNTSSTGFTSAGTTASGPMPRTSPGTSPSLLVQMKGDLNTSFLGDEGGYGGCWVPLAALKKVLRSILKYLGVLWLFAQLPDLLKGILGSLLKENEGALLNLDLEQPALRFFVGGYVFAVSVHRVQLLLQVLSVKRFHNQQQQQQQQPQNNAQEELAAAEISEICDYFSRRVASEPFDASRVASFITLLTLPISVLREFIKLIDWKKRLGLSTAAPHVADTAAATATTPPRVRIELCLENHSGLVSDESPDTPSFSSRSNILHNRSSSFVEFGLTFVFDPAHVPHLNVAGGAAWLQYCVSVRLRYSFRESNHQISFMGMEGSHGGRACWLQQGEEWEKCKQRVVRTIEALNAGAPNDVSQGRLRTVAEMLHKALQASLQQLRENSALASANIAAAAVAT